jgi:hypothetical protein
LGAAESAGAARRTRPIETDNAMKESVEKTLDVVDSSRISVVLYEHPFNPCNVVDERPATVGVLIQNIVSPSRQ